MHIAHSFPPAIISVKELIMFRKIIVSLCAMAAASALAMAPAAQAQIAFRKNLYDGNVRSHRTYSRPYYSNNYYNDGSVAVSRPQASQSFTTETIDIKAGDNVKTTTDAQLRMGDKVLATVPQGEMHIVLKVIGPWVGISTDQAGEEVRGWVNFRSLEAVR